jgi:PAS domain S-box-containing protein
MIQDSYEALLDSANLGIMATDQNGFIISINKIARSLLDYKNEIVLNKTNYSIIDPAAWKDFVMIMKKRKPQISIYNQKQGYSIVTERSPIIIQGEIRGIISIFQAMDRFEKLTDHFKGYKDLVRQLETIIESSYDGLYVTDGKANTIKVNSAYEKITGIKASDLIGRNMKDLVREGYFSDSATLKVLETGKVVTISQVLKSGKSILVTANPILNDNGQIIMVAINVRDMTDLLELSNKLEKSLSMTLAYKQTLQNIQWSSFEKNEFVCLSRSMHSILEMVEHVSNTNTTIFLYGETGVGKDRIADEIHNKSSRSRKGLIVRINCGAIPETLLESELFGYEKGAFTGANKEGKAGLFEVADGGTLFLDEVEAMPLILQSKLLRVVQNFEITRLGSTTSKKVDVRLICASNQVLKKLVEKKLFREDLFYRLNVVPMFIPPLRERVEDIPYLAYFFLNRFNRKNSKTKTISKEAMNRLSEYSWPGNVRELENLIERMVVAIRDECIMPHHLPLEFHDKKSILGTFSDCTFKNHMKKVEEEYILNAVNIYGNARKASYHIGLDPSTITRKLKQYKQRNAF